MEVCTYFSADKAQSVFNEKDNIIIIIIAVVAILVIVIIITVIVVVSNF